MIRPLLSAALALALTFAPVAAWAYRPFDQTARTTGASVLSRRPTSSANAPA